MSRDSQPTYIHLTNSHYALYISNWVHDKLPNEHIEVPGFHLDDDDDDSSSAFQQSAFGSIKSHRKAKVPSWKDLDLQKLMNDDFSVISEIQDQTLLKKLEHLHDLDSRENERQSGPSPHTSSIQNETVSRPSNLPSFEISTPDVRNRSAQRNLQNYQTPIGRIMR